MREKAMSWAAVDGNLNFHLDSLTFRGEPTPYINAQGQEQIGLAIGLAVNNARFYGGDITAQIEFATIGENNSCEIVFYFDPLRRWFVSAGLGAGFSYFIRHWDGRWHTHTFAGRKENLEAGRQYNLKVSVRGSKVTLAVDDVEVISAVVPFSLPPSQTGVHFLDDDEVKVSNFRVDSRQGRVFVVMQFSSPFMEIHDEVIKVVCEGFGLEAHRADETYGPGLIIADVTRDLAESEFVIAEITPANPNVYYELGYAHAINKPVILLADKNIEKLPFDVSGFRVLFYENSILGRRKFEEGLRKHISAILQLDPIPGGKSS